MPGRSKYLIVAFSVLTLLLISAITLLHYGKPPATPVAADQNISLVNKLGFLNCNDTVRYAGIEKCRKCHEDVYKTYMQTGMGQSWGLANPAKSISVFKPGHFIYDQKSDFFYLPFWNGDEMMVREFRLNHGDTVYERTESVDYVVGSGQHTNSHIKNINGYLVQVPFTFYRQTGILDFPPGFEGGHNARFSRKIGFECISCHNSYPVPVEGSINKYQSVPLGINCERCHGPGELHIKAMEEGKIVDIKKVPDFTIVRPSRLPIKLRFELCSRCHSQGNTVLRKDRSFFDFKPGMYVSDILDVFREKYENEEDAFWMETHPERLKQSRCFKESQNNPDFEQLTCLSCHFTSSMMHQSVTKTPADTFNAICRRCHNLKHNNFCTETPGNRQSQQNNCFKCHMPKTGVMDIPHVAITDHHIRVTNKWKGPVVSTNDIKTGQFRGLKCMTNDHPDDYILARAWLYHYEKFYAVPAVLDSAYHYLVKFPPEKVAAEWITYYYLKGDWKKVAGLAETYHPENTSDPVINYDAGQAYHNLAQTDKALYYFGKAVALQPFNLEYRNKYGTELLISHQNDKALKEFFYIISEDPYMTSAYNNIGFINLLNKDFSTASYYFRKALEYDPDYLNAHLNLVKMMLAKGNLHEAENYLLKLKTKFPGEKQLQQMLQLTEQYINENK